MVSGGLGMDLSVGSGYIPIYLTYSMLLGQDQNLADSIAVLIGYAFPL